MRADWRDWFAFFCFCLMFSLVVLAIAGAFYVLDMVL